ncbi:hypothetical protein KEM54_006141 [Ascosphaera aggregata]|nr:hypothetical protein KEM54_006141 [Ascosphaera aggregata]
MRFLQILWFASLAQCLSSAPPDPIEHFEGLTQRDLDALESEFTLAKRFSVGKWASACFGLELDRFSALFGGGNFFGLLLPLLSTPCYPTASTLLRCGIQGGISRVTDLRLLASPDIGKVKGCLCKNADFMGEFEKCYNCARNNGASVLPDFSAVLNMSQVARDFCSIGQSNTARRSAASLNGTASIQSLQNETVTAGPTASNVVVSTGVPTSDPRTPQNGNGSDSGDRNGASLPVNVGLSDPETNAAISTVYASLHAMGSTLFGVMLLTVMAL